MDLSIIIPTKERKNILDKTLAYALQATGHIDAEIIVVCDSAESYPAKEHCENLICTIIEKLRSGVASKRNAGAAIAKSDLILFLDDDILISRESIDHVLLLHNTEKNICVNPDWVYPPEIMKNISTTSFGRFMIKKDLTSFKGWYGHPRWRENSIFESPILASFHLSMDKKIFFNSGGYDESFPHAGFEDYDFPHRLKKTGMKFLIDTRILVYHNEEDKINSMETWIGKQKDVAVTRKHAVNIGYSEFEIKYSGGKKIILEFLSLIKPPLISLTKVIPNFRLFDPLYFSLLSALLSATIFEGYNNKK